MKVKKIFLSAIRNHYKNRYKISSFDYDFDDFNYATSEDILRENNRIACEYFKKKYKKRFMEAKK